jgi:alpha/beta hydrolase family protein
VRDDLSPIEARVVTAMRGPADAARFQHRCGPPAWREGQCWYVIAESDGIINPELERWTARRMRAVTNSVSGASHDVSLSHPIEVAQVILAAAEAGTLPLFRAHVKTVRHRRGAGSGPSSTTTSPSSTVGILHWSARQPGAGRLRPTRPGGRRARNPGEVAKAWPGSPGREYCCSSRCPGFLSGELPHTIACAAVQASRSSDSKPTWRAGVESDQTRR